MNLGRCFTAAFALALTASPALAQNHWVASWGAGSVTSLPKLQDNMPPNGLTYRNIARMSLGGSQVRLTLSNRFGTDPLTIDHVTVAISNGDDSIEAASLQQVTFGVNRNSASVTIQPGDTVFSNPVSIAFAAQADLAVSIHVPQQQISQYTDHPISHQTNYVANADQANATSLTNPTNFMPWHFLSAIDVQAPAGDFAIVAFGDSITDGAGDGDTPGSNHRWPNFLSDRLYQNGYTNVAIVNEGIGSDRVLHDGTQNPHSGLTPSALNRWQPDALERAGVKYIILIEGVNDIGASDEPRGPVITAEQLIQAYQQLIEEAHQAGVRVIMGTMTPFYDAHYWKSDGEGIHDKVNAWIRGGTANGFDGLIDFDAAVELPNPNPSPTSPDQWDPNYNSTDHLHPNTAGKQAMADTIDLSMFN